MIMGCGLPGALAAMLSEPENQIYLPPLSSLRRFMNEIDCL